MAINPNIEIIVDDGGGGGTVTHDPLDTGSSINNVTIGLYNKSTHTVVEPTAILFTVDQYNSAWNSNSYCNFSIGDKIAASNYTTLKISTTVDLEIFSLQFFVDNFVFSEIDLFGGNTGGKTCNYILIAKDSSYSTPPVGSIRIPLVYRNVSDIECVYKENYVGYSYGYQLYPLGSGNPFGGFAFNTNDFNKITFSDTGFHYLKVRVGYLKQSGVDHKSNLTPQYATIQLGVIEVVPPVYKSVNVSSSSTHKTNYKQYETFSTSGLKVDIKYYYRVSNTLAYTSTTSVGSNETSPANGTLLRDYGGKTVTINVTKYDLYTWENITKSTTYSIYVKEVAIKFGSKIPTLYIKLNGTKKTVKEVRLKDVLLYKHD